MPDPNTVPAFLSIFSQPSAEKTPVKKETPLSDSHGSETVKQLRRRNG